MSGVRASTILRALQQLPSDDRTDAELLRCFARTRDEGAFATLVQRHGAMVRNVCRRVLHHCQDAEDACQATFLVLAARANTVAWQSSAANWLYGVARRVALKGRALRRRSQRVHAPSVSRSPVDPLAEICGRELLGALDDALDSLPDKYRAPLVLCYLEGATRDEAARQLGWPVGTLKSRVERARDLLHARLVRRGLSLTAALASSVLSGERSATAALVGERVQNIVKASLLHTTAPEQLARPLSVFAAQLARTAQRGILVERLMLPLQLVAATALLAVGLGFALEGPSTGETAGRPEPPAAHQTTVEPGKGPARLDGFGHPLPAGAVARMGTPQFAHAVRVLDIALFPDDKSVVSAYGGSGGWPEGALRLWEGATGKELRRFGSDLESSLALARDGKRLVSTHNNEIVRVWDTTTYREERHFTGRKPLALSEDGKLLALARLGPPAPEQGSAPNGRGPAGKEGAHGMGVASTDEWVEVRDLETGKRVQSIPGEARVMAFSPDGRFLAVARNRCAPLRDFISLRSVETGEEITAWKDLNGFPDYLLFAPDGKRLIALAGYPYDQQWCWEVATGKLLWHVPSDHQRQFSVCGASLSPDGTMLATARHWQIVLQDAMTGKELRRIRTGYRADSARLVFSADRKHLSLAGVEKLVRQWDLTTGRELYRAGGHLTGVKALAVSPDGKTLASAGQSLRWWDLATGQERSILSGEAYLFDHLTFAPDGQSLLTHDWDRNYRTWQVATGTSRLVSELGPDDCGAISPDLRLLARAERGAVVVRELAGGKERRRWNDLPDGVSQGLVFSEDGTRLALKDSSGGFVLWSVVTGKELCRLPALLDPRNALFLNSDLCGAPFLFSADGQVFLVRSEDGLVTVWDSATGKALQCFPRTLDASFCLALSPDGKTLATAGRDGTIVLWEIATGEKRGAIQATQTAAGKGVHGHEGLVHCLAFSPDGRFLISGSDDCTALVWDLAKATGR